MLGQPIRVLINRLPQGGGYRVVVDQRQPLAGWMVVLRETARSVGESVAIGGRYALDHRATIESVRLNDAPFLMPALADSYQEWYFAASRLQTSVRRQYGPVGIWLHIAYRGDRDNERSATA